jgi:ubiquinone/menaquinone biosynthesis C-methylase UbiE
MTDVNDVRTIVRERYGSIAEGRSCGCGCGCAVDQPESAGADTRETILDKIGYSADQAAAVPGESNLGLGCGNPLAHAAVRAGETVLDLGSGAGIDCFLAAREVGPSGRVIGVDMTAPMIDRARAAAARGGYATVEFRLGEIEHLPVADASVDLVISNCVVNLSPEKLQVFREALRALKPGGRMVVSDLVWVRPMPESIRASMDALIGCVAGATLKDDYLELMRRAGFASVEVVEETRYAVGLEELAKDEAEREAFDHVRSVKVRALKAA